MRHPTCLPDGHHLSSVGGNQVATRQLYRLGTLSRVVTNVSGPGPLPWRALGFETDGSGKLRESTAPSERHVIDRTPCRRLESVEPEDAMFVLHRWQTSTSSLWLSPDCGAQLGLRRRPQLLASLDVALAQFDRVLPESQEDARRSRARDDYALE